MAAGEICRISVRQAHRAIDELRAGVDRVLHESDAADHIDQLGRSRAHDRTRCAHDLGEHAVAVRRVCFLVVTRPGNNEVVAGEAGEIGQVLRAGDGAVDHRGAIDLVAGSVELLHEHIVGAATDAVVAVPGHHKAAVAQRGDAGVVLIGHAIDRADLELPAHLRTAAVETLAMDLVVGRPPHHHVAAVGEHRHIVAVLVAGDRARHSLLGHRDRAIGVEDLAEHTVATAVVGTGIGIYSDELATRQRRQARVELGARDGGVEGELTTKHHAIGAIALREHVVDVARTRGGVIAAISNDEATIAQADHRRFVLVAGSRRVDAELVARERPVGTITLGIDTAARAVLTIRAPHHHEAAVGERAHFGLVLVAESLTADLELGAHGSAPGVVALAEDTVAAAVLAIVRAPYHHVAARVRAL